jgi:hypothetical protein
MAITMSYLFWVWHSDSLQTGQPAKWIPVGARLSALVQTGPAAHPASCTTGNWFQSQGQSGRGIALNTHPHLAPRLKKEYRNNVTFPPGLHGRLHGEHRVSQLPYAVTGGSKARKLSGSSARFTNSSWSFGTKQHMAFPQSTPYAYV